jgi:transposase-like protein
MRLGSVPLEEGAHARRSDPRRLPRRNHYQEGTGFLGPATQGGRPPESVVPGATAGAIRHRAAALRRWREGEPVAGLCAEPGVPRATLFRWRSRFEEAGLGGLADRVHVGRASELDPVLEQVIRTVRLLGPCAERPRAPAVPGHGIWCQRVDAPDQEPMPSHRSISSRDGTRPVDVTAASIRTTGTVKSTPRATISNGSVACRT